MFRCDVCGKITKAGEKQTKRTVETKNKSYRNLDKFGKERISKGTEIVKEINMCEKCAKQC